MIVRPMVMEDIQAIMKLENSLYKTPWNEKMMVEELTTNKYAYIFILEEKNLIIGFYGIWIVNDYATVTKVSIMKELQGHGLGKVLMNDMIDRCQKANVVVIDLEVRKSNLSAISLYKSFDFVEVGIRKGYYSDGEDAIAMVKNLQEGEHYEKIHLGN